MDTPTQILKCDYSLSLRVEVKQAVPWVLMVVQHEEFKRTQDRPDLGSSSSSPRWMQALASPSVCSFITQSSYTSASASSSRLTRSQVIANSCVRTIDQTMLFIFHEIMWCVSFHLIPLGNFPDVIFSANWILPAFWFLIFCLFLCFVQPTDFFLLKKNAL